MHPSTTIDDEVVVVAAVLVLVVAVFVGSVDRKGGTVVDGGRQSVVDYPIFPLSLLSPRYSRRRNLVGGGTVDCLWINGHMQSYRETLPG